jgi:hypothetical protein
VKITSDEVLNLLRKLERTEGTVAFLELIKSVLIAYVNSDTSLPDRIYHAAFAIQFIRIWRQWLHENNISAEYFITMNSWEGLELNFVWLLKMTINSKANDIDEQSSQKCEGTFRTVRSFTGVESTVVNCSMKSFLSRIHKIELNQKMMVDLKEHVEFPKMNEQKLKQQKPKIVISQEEIETIIDRAVFDAAERASHLGMVCPAVKPELFLKKVKSKESTQNENLEEEHGNDEPILADVNTDEIFNGADEICDFDKSIVLHNVEFTNEKSG